MADLITLSRAKLSIPDYEDTDAPTVSKLISAASAIIERATGRSFITATYTERHDGGRRSILLRNYPVTALDWVATARSTCLSITNTSSTNQRAHATTTETGLRLTRVASGAISIDTSVTWANNATIAAVASAVNNLGNGWSASVVGDFGLWPSSEIYDGQATSCISPATVDLKIFDEHIDCSLREAASGIVDGRFPYGMKNILVRYVAGYSQSSLPADLQEAVALLVSSLFDEHQGDGDLRSEVLGDYEYEKFDSKSAWPKQAFETVMLYRSIRV